MQEQSAPNGPMIDAVPAADEDDLLSLDEAVQFLTTSRPTFYRLLGQGDLKGFKVGRQWRFRRSELLAYLERRPPEVAPAPPEALEAELEYFGDEVRRAGGSPPAEDSELTDAGQRRTDRLARAIIELAVVAGASDIHLEPARQDGDAYSLLRHRLDGLLHEIRRLPASLHEALIGRWKQMAGMDVAERRLPQAGRIPFSRAGRQFELRLSCLPTLFGEAMVMRILDKSTQLLGLDRLGLSEPDRERIRSLIRQPNGILVAVGAAGSGRKTLLYSCLQEIAGVGKKSMIVDEVIEHVLPFTTPVPVNKRAGFPLETALRVVMRHDPDVLLIGEIQELATAQRVLSTALTGHLVLTYLMANSAVEGVRRLLDLGAEPIAVGRTLLGVVHQRLVRRICANCKEASAAPPADDPLLAYLRDQAAAGGFQVPEEVTLFRARGCDQCRGSGYKGRIGLFEVLFVNEALTSAILRDATVEELTEIAVENGMRTLMADGIRKAVEGETTVDEVLRVLSVPF
jgi:excisionase family DNA binding protein